jgi:CheY-like chemotaxis protein
MSKKILVVDDEDFIVEIIEEILTEDMDCQVTTTENGQMGLSLAQEDGYDLIITDYNMPVMTGGEFANQLRAAEGPNTSTPILFVSGFSDPAKKESKGLENVFFMDKPIIIDKLIASVTEAMG